MKEIILSFLTGLLTGGVFAFIRLPVPAPSTLSGVLGVVGLFIGYFLVKRFTDL
ncbi:uncharacterized protein METZ01_LOCUS95082 [marine metagenome]|jgi:XapX domain-containing protein|uniref:XapX domain-containing protein n=1 Tax=marine metagenome TaxID=408172 RepID=A0A381VR46_9ZZZZ